MTGRRDKWWRVITIVALLAAVAMLCIGGFRRHKVYDADAAEFGIAAFDRITDRQLVEDATFGGVARQEGRLYSTYDRTVERGKKACPT